MGLKTSDRCCAPAKDEICGAAYVASSKERRGSDDHFRMVIPLDAISPSSPPLTKPLRRPSRDDITVISGLDDSLSGYDSDTTFESDRESDDDGSVVISHVDIKRMAMLNNRNRSQSQSPGMPVGRRRLTTIAGRLSATTAV